MINPIQRNPMTIFGEDSNTPDFIFGVPVVLDMDKSR